MQHFFCEAEGNCKKRNMQLKAQNKRQSNFWVNFPKVLEGDQELTDMLEFE